MCGGWRKRELKVESLKLKAGRRTGKSDGEEKDNAETQSAQSSEEEAKARARLRGGRSGRRAGKPRPYKGMKMGRHARCAAWGGSSVAVGAWHAADDSRTVGGRTGLVGDGGGGERRGSCRVC